MSILKILLTVCVVFPILTACSADKNSKETKESENVIKEDKAILLNKFSERKLPVLFKTAADLSEYHELFSDFSGVEKEIISKYKLPEDKLLSQEDKKKIFPDIDLTYNIMPLFKVKILDNYYLAFGCDVNRFFACMTDFKGNPLGKTLDFYTINQDHKGNFAFTGFEINESSIVLNTKGEGLVLSTQKVEFTKNGLKEQ